jgi:LPS-assembly lipoprotein
MSWSETVRLGRIGLVFASTLVLGGCLQPMYGKVAPVVSSTTPALNTPGSVNALASVDILPIDGRVGQKIRNDLIFAFTGGGAPLPPVYRLDITVQIVAAQTAIVDPFTDRPELETAGVEAAFALIKIGSGEPILSGNALGRATYTRNRQRFASTRAQRDAEDRAARVVVEQIRARLMAHFAGTGT